MDGCERRVRACKTRMGVLRYMDAMFALSL